MLSTDDCKQTGSKCPEIVKMLAIALKLGHIFLKEINWKLIVKHNQLIRELEG